MRFLRTAIRVIAVVLVVLVVILGASAAMLISHVRPLGSVKFVEAMSP